MSGSECRIAGLGAVLGLCAAVLSAPAMADGWRVTLRGGTVDLAETPIVTEVNNDFLPGIYQLESAPAGAGVPAQVFQDGEKRFSRVHSTWARRGSDDALFPRQAKDSGYRTTQEGSGLALTARALGSSAIKSTLRATGSTLGPSRFSFPCSARPATRTPARTRCTMCRRRTVTIRTSGHVGSLMATSTASTSGPRAKFRGRSGKPNRNIIVEGLVLARLHGGQERLARPRRQTSLS